MPQGFSILLHTLINHAINQPLMCPIMWLFLHQVLATHQVQLCHSSSNQRLLVLSSALHFIKTVPSPLTINNFGYLPELSKMLHLHLLPYIAILCLQWITNLLLHQCISLQHIPSSLLSIHDVYFTDNLPSPHTKHSPHASSISTSTTQAELWKHSFTKRFP